MIIPTYSQFRVSFALPASPLDPDGYPRWPVEKVREPGSGFGDSGSTLRGIPKPATNHIPILVSCNNYQPDAVPFADQYNWFFEARTENTAAAPVTVSAPDLHFGITTGITRIRTLNGGISWSDVSVTPPAGVGLVGVAQPTVSDMWMCGGDGAIFYSADAGDTWVPQLAPTPAGLLDIHFADSQSGYAVGAAVGATLTFFKTSDGGTTWANVTPPVASSITYYGVSTLLDPNYAIVVGDSGQTWRTTDGGANWALVTLVPGPTITDVSTPPFFPNIPPAYTSYSCTSLGEIWKTTDGGASWTQVNSGLSGGLFSLYALDINTVWACGLGGTVLKTVDGGATWSVTSVGPVDSVITSVHFYDLNNGYAVGYSTTDFNALAYRTVDGGTTWEEVVVSGQALIKTAAPRQNMSLVSFSGTVQLTINPAYLTGTILSVYDAISPEEVVSIFKNNDLYVQRGTDDAIQWVDLLRAMTSNTG